MENSSVTKVKFRARDGSRNIDSRFDLVLCNFHGGFGGVSLAVTCSFAEAEEIEGLAKPPSLAGGLSLRSC